MRSLNVLPSAARSNVGDLGSRDSKSVSKNPLSFSAGANRSNVQFGQDGSGVPLAASTSIMPNGVRAIFELSSNFKVKRIHASVPTAQVPSHFAAGGRNAARQDDRHHVHAEPFALVGNFAVAGRVGAKGVRHALLNIFTQAPLHSLRQPRKAGVEAGSAGRRVTVHVLPVIVAVTEAGLKNRIAAAVESAGKLGLRGLVGLVIARAAHAFGQVWSAAFGRLADSGHRGSSLGSVRGV